MKNFKLLLLLPLLLSGCAGTEDYTTTTDSASTQQVETIETDTEEQDTIETEGAPTVSAENQIGRDLNIVAVAQYNQNLSTFFELIRNAGLTILLESPGNYTVFAPTNEAFNALPAGMLEILKDPVNKAELTRIIRAHILEDKVMAAGLRNNTAFETAIGEHIKVTVANGTIVVGDAKVIKEDIDASNGVVHIVDKVLIPPKQ